VFSLVRLGSVSSGSIEHLLWVLLWIGPERYETLIALYSPNLATKMPPPHVLTVRYKTDYTESTYKKSYWFYGKNKR